MQPGDFVKLGDNSGLLQYAYLEDALGEKGKTYKERSAWRGMILSEDMPSFVKVLWNGKFITDELSNTLVTLW